MVRFMRAARFFPMTLVALGLACTIVEDSDITSAKQFNLLPLKSIEIVQSTHSGNKKTQMKLTYDSTINIIDSNTGAKIVRRLGFSFADLGNLKMKLRSGTSGETEIFTTYKEGGQPYTFAILKGDSAVEIYRFRYDANGRLNKVVTIINPVDNLPALVFTNDSLIYGTSSNISSIIRKSPFDPSKAATINIEYGGPNSSLTISNFAYLAFRYQQTSGNCPNGSNDDACVAYMAQPNSGGGGNNSMYNLVASNTLDRLTQISVEDRKANNPSNGTDYDSYYFHPVFLLRNQLTVGKYLTIIYSMDWMVPGAQLTGSSNINFSQDDIVNINFNYGN